MKVIFLDVDGVLNSEQSLMADNELEDTLLLRLKSLVDKTGAKIVLSSSWRFSFYALSILIDKLSAINLYLYGLTPNGVSVKWIEKQGFSYSDKYLETRRNTSNQEIKITTDRGAEILKWLYKHKDSVESFVILDDEEFDIKSYFPEHIVKTNFKNGLTLEDIELAKRILLEKEIGNEN